MSYSAPAVRRNGLLQSCEPCRKSKLKCDHGRPVCGRCTSKNITQKCFYHPAPMTKQDGSSQGRPSKKQRRESNPDVGHSGSSSPTTSGVEYSALRITSEPSSVTPGYLGSTSFSAVLSEHRTDISFDVDSAATGEALAKPVDRIRLQSAVEVLRLLGRSTIYDSSIRKFYAGSLAAAVSFTIVDALLRSIKRVFSGLDSSRDHGSQLQDLACQIFRSSARPLTSHASMTVVEYCASFTDKNLRWEAVGIIFATAGITLMSTPDNDPEFIKVAPDAQTRDIVRAQALEASGVCLGFCDDSASVNELLGFFQYNDVILRTQYYGDSSYQAWRRLGDLTATIYAAGLHQESIRAEDCPPFLHQWRRICFASAFYADKCLSTFVGRPPFLHYRYCTLSPPLDLSDDVLIAGGEPLSQALSELDAAGWNAHGNDFRVSISRLRFLMSVFREQALEIALGTADDWDLVHNSKKVIEKAQRTWETCPARLRYDLHAKDSAYPTMKAFALRHIYLDYLYTLFLIQRTLVKRTNTGHEALFTTSREALSIVVGIVPDKDPAVDLSRHHSWVVLYYGLPSASILTLELLRQTQEVGPHPVVLPRAELIRNLSVFVSCLSWVAPRGHGNYRTCKAVEKKLSEILDQILDPQPAQREIMGSDISGPQGLLEWYNPDNWDLDAYYFPLRDGFPF